MTVTRTIAASFTLLALTAGVAAADPDATNPPELKDPAIARALSIGGALASTAMVIGGAAMSNQNGSGTIAAIGSLSFLVTPSLGEWYAGQPLTVGMGIRVGGALVALGGVAAMLDGDPICFEDCTSQRNDGEVAVGEGLLIVGGLTVIGGIVYDIVDAPSAADRYNNAHQLQIVPSVLPTPSGTVPAVGLSGTF